MNQGELDTSESSQLVVSHCRKKERKILSLLELLKLIDERQAGMHSLHAQNLIVALLVIEHGGCKVLECGFRSEWSISLCDNQTCKDRLRQYTDCYPLWPNKEFVRVVVRWMNVFDGLGRHLASIRKLLSRHVCSTTTTKKAETISWNTRTRAASERVSTKRSRPVCSRQRRAVYCSYSQFAGRSGARRTRIAGEQAI